MEVSSFVSPSEIYYFVPKASCPLITQWIETNVSVKACNFHGSFINWAIRFAQEVSKGTKLVAEMGDEEQQLYHLLRDGFPVTDPSEYAIALQYHLKNVFMRGMKSGPTGPPSFDYSRGHIKPELFDDPDAIRDGRRRLLTLVPTKPSASISKSSSPNSKLC